MNWLRFFFALVLCLSWVYFLSNPISFGTTNVPPPGKILSVSDGFWKNAEPVNQEPISIDLEVDSLVGTVEIIYDSLNIPHVFAENRYDLFFAQGYVTAKDRLWQMDFQTRGAAGRISEIVGDIALDYDRSMRRRGLVFAAENALQALMDDPETKEVVLAYTAGANHYISQLEEKDLPIEYKILDYKPEKWTPLKTALLLKMMANDLAFRNNDFQYTNLYQKLGKEIFDLIYPEHLENEDPIINSERKWDFKGQQYGKNIDSINSVYPENMFDQPDKDNGSNNWAVSGSKTKSGYPILANDPHLRLQLPSIWYIIHLQAPGYEVMGASIPGSPAVISGFNRDISWGVTNARRDLVDWYSIEFKNEDKKQYLHEGKFYPTRPKIETIEIKGKKSFIDTVIYTHHGPVMYDESFGADSPRKGFAMKWIAHERSNELKTFVQLNSAENYDEYRLALNHYKSPAQNFVFASTNGDIAMTIQGKFPVRFPEQGKFVMDGTSSVYDWSDYIPSENNASSINPKRGFVSSANQVPTSTDYPYWYLSGDYEHYRNRVINTELAEMNNITVEDMMTLQQNNKNLKAKEILPWMLDTLNIIDMSASQKAVLSTLNKWDFNNDPDKVGPVYFKIWYDTLTDMIWKPIKDLGGPVLMPEDGALSTLLINGTIKPYIEKYNISLEDSIRESFIRSVTVIDTLLSQRNDSLTWASYKDTYASHLVPAFKSFNETHLNIGGGQNIVNATKENHGPAWRMIVSMEPGNVQGYAIIAGGQGGNPGSSKYNQFIRDWAAGKYYKLNFAKKKEDLLTNNVVLRIKQK
ncbi:penicillin acylase family protein [Marinigracilibium pacificum]|uniref:Penicillin acylase family protein n=1 Tax=Marinigracilibium pacificum TaxID=2729599 RepID=A0A848J4G7_9BACT|nr:penicillin acylase family protein [Marinigracilibium pacificum]NMM48062.1 penicillin acylase family protein [Marinigracilibium pacificum]